MANIDVLALTPIATTRGQASFDLQFRLERVLKEEIGIIQRLFSKVSDGWKPEDKPTWNTPGPELRGGSLSAVIETDSIPWVFLDLGTSVRHAVMGRGFRPRTRKGTFGSRSLSPGSDPVVVHRNIRKRGIESRDWSVNAAKRRQIPLTKKVQGEMTKYANRQFRSDIKAKRIFVIPLFP